MLQKALVSIGQQTYERIEVVIVDGSIDPVPPERIESWLEGVEHVVRLEDSGHGAAAARNRGIRAAAGAYIAFLDDDDRWTPTKLHRQVERFDLVGNRVGVVYTGQVTIDRDETPIRSRTPSTRGKVTEALLRGADVTPFSAMMVRTEAARAAGLLDERLPVWEDLDWYIRLSRRTEVEPVAEPLALRRMGDHDQLTDRFETIRDVALPRFLAKHRPLAASYGPDCERAMVASRLLDVAHAGLEQGAYAEALPLLARSLRLSPRSRRTQLYLLAALGGPLTYRPAKWLRRHVTTVAVPG